MGLASPYLQPRLSEPGSVALAGAAAGLPIRGMEVVQTVQNLRNEVSLIADKPTVVRVYLDPTSLATATTVSAELAWNRGTGGDAFLPAMSNLRLDPSQDPGLVGQRFDVQASLNFRLPSAAIGAGRLNVKLNRVFAAGGADVPLAGRSSVAVDFVPGPTLRIRAVGLRYKTGTPAIAVTPDAIHFAFLRSYLTRAYPTADLVWSQIVVDANFRAPFNGSTVDLANAQLAAIRAREVSAGIDPRTHYYGLVDDNLGAPDHFMRGKAFTIPATPRPDVVACGPVGTPNGFSGDQDRSYADWYGAHELGHTFGRFHPGFPPFNPATGVGQDASDPTFPYPAGRLTTADDAHVGLDVGDPDLGISMQALSGRTHHDIMTYEDNQWISAYTFEAILQRLSAEEALAPLTI